MRSVTPLIGGNLLQSTVNHQNDLLMLIHAVESTETIAETLNWNESLSFSHKTHTLTVFWATRRDEISSRV